MSALADVGADFALPASPARFANNLKIATMAAVKLELGSKAGVDVTNINGTGVMVIGSVSMFGKVNLLGCASTNSCNLLTATLLADGTSITLVNVNPTGGASVNVMAAGAQTMRVGAANLNTVLMRPGDVMELTVYSGNYYMTGGTCAAALDTNFAFTKLLSGNGYQKLPGGMIIQWALGTASTAGTINTLPIAFPSNCASVVAMPQANNNSSPIIGGQANASQVYLYSASGSPSCLYIAIGY